MNEDGSALLDELITRVLLGVADESERESLAVRLAESDGARERFLDHVAVHGFLAEEAKAGSLAEDRGRFFSRLEVVETGAVKPSVWRRCGLPAVAAAAALLIGLLAVSIPLWPAKAIGALDHVIEALDKPLDRSYRIEAPGGASHAATPKPGDRGRFPPGVHLNGARFHLRGSDCFVLEQQLPTGETRIMGSDGKTSWSVRGKGPVRISGDLSRFGGRMAIRRQEIAFLDLRGQLEELKRLYRIEWLDDTSSPGSGLRGLEGTRRSREQGGAKRIELWFDPASGLIHRLVFSGLPVRNGGPETVVVVLESCTPLSPDFFGHEFHHEPGRLVVPEPLSEP